MKQFVRKLSMYMSEEVDKNNKDKKHYQLIKAN